MSVSFGVVGAAANSPTCNFANANARPVVEIMTGTPPEYLCDDLPAEDVAPALRRVVAALNVPARRTGGLRAAEVGGSVHVCASTDEDVQRRLKSVLDVLKHASDHKVGVWWG
jgi:hypothetical protein